MRKHGGSVQAVLDHGARARARRDELAGAEVACARTEQELERRPGGARAATSTPCAGRASSPRPRVWRARCVSSWPRWRWQDATFEVLLSAREPGPSGGDAVEFMIAPNPGVPAGPLREIASGGELSRVMLAIMSVATAACTDSTLVFDEVDAGIGGHTARAVGARLRELGAGQTGAVHHPPAPDRLARRSSLHDRQGHLRRAHPRRPSCSSASREVVSELVRMLGADTADAAARRHARELRRAA